MLLLLFCWQLLVLLHLLQEVFTYTVQLFLVSFYKTQHHTLPAAPVMLQEQDVGFLCQLWLLTQMISLLTPSPLLLSPHPW